MRSPSASDERIGARAESAHDSTRRNGDERFLLTLWTDDPRLAVRAERAGIDRVGVDLETLGKAERQSGLKTWISPHTVDDLPAIRECLRSASLFARINPPHEHTGAEIELLLDHGVQVLMLPMFDSAEQAARFIDLVDGRAEPVLLLETVAAARDVDRIVEVPGVREIHVGINDLALSLGMRNRFEVLDCEPIEHVSACVLDAGLRLGIGGIGRIGDLGLPIPPALIYAQYPRLGATAALVSRTFLRTSDGPLQLHEEVTRSRECMARWFDAGPDELEHARTKLREALDRCGGW
jgi:hypothetical protein